MKTKSIKRVGVFNHNVTIVRASSTNSTKKNVRTAKAVGSSTR